MAVEEDVDYLHDQEKAVPHLVWEHYRGLWVEVLYQTGVQVIWEAYLSAGQEEVGVVSLDLLVVPFLELGYLVKPS